MLEQIKITNKSRDFGYIHLLAHLNEEVIGKAISLIIRHTALLEEFQVKRSIRNNGVGSLLLNETERLAYGYGAHSIIRIGMFYDTNSLSDYVETVKFLSERGYSYRIVYLSKKLK